MISVAKPQADRADPRKILGDFLCQTEFMGEPIFTLFTDEIYENGNFQIDEIKHYVRHKIDLHPTVFELRQSLVDFFDRFNGWRYKKVAEVASGEITSTVYHSNWAWNDPLMVSAVISNPCHIMTPNRLLQMLGVSRTDCVPLMKENLSWNFLVHAHERAHTIGAQEPQADKIAAVLCRKNFKNSASVALMSDIRALHAVRTGVQSYGSGHQEASIEHQMTLMIYGYPPVEVSDSVLAMSQDKIEAMTDGDIGEFRHEQYHASVIQVLNLGKIAITTYLKAGQMILSPSINDIAEGAALLAQKIDTSTNDPKVGVIAHRFALATKRLAEGAPAYAAVQETVQKFGSLTPT